MALVIWQYIDKWIHKNKIELAPHETEAIIVRGKGKAKC